MSRRWRIGLVLAALGAASCATAPAPAPAPPAAPRASERPVESGAADSSRAAPGEKESQPEAAPHGAASTREPQITVGLAWDLDSLTLDPAGEAVIEGVSRGSMAVEERLSIRLRSGGGAVARVRGGAGAWQASLGSSDTLWVTGISGAEDAPERWMGWNGKTWRGQFKVFLNPRGKLTVASRMPLEDYLLGVLPGEIGPLAEDLLEAGRAQAVAARSFTLFYTGRRGVEGFDLFSTVEDQVYGSVESEKPLASRCVESTAGEVALYQGAPIRANYSSTCGGITADVWEAWATPPLPYLLSHRDRGRGGDNCAASPHYRWHEEFSASEFMGNLRRFAPTYGVRLPAGGPGELLDVEVTARSRSGRAWVVVVTTTRGQITIPAYSLRQVLRRPGRPDAILRSNLIKVGVRRNPATRRARDVVVSGAGSGHGVGLCQTGALGMARAGRKGEEIILHYFSGVEIRRTR